MTRTDGTGLMARRVGLMELDRNSLDLKLGGNTRRVVSDPPLVLALFGETRFALFWLVARVYLGWSLLSAGREKLGDPAWMDGGAALRASWLETIRTSSGGNRDLLQFLVDHGWHGWLAPAIAVGETLIGIALILGLFTGIAAFTGGLMTFTAVLAGSAATNPLLFTIAVLLVLAWKTGGWIGLDRWTLPTIGHLSRTTHRGASGHRGSEVRHQVRTTG